MARLVSGLGINDLDYAVAAVINGKQERCPFYFRWKHMLTRCSDTYKEKDRGVYADKEVHPEWLRASNFKSWMENQHWQGYDLDKDILVPGNKIYGPDTCVFIPQWLNKVVICADKARGKYPLGVSYLTDKNMVNEKSKPFVSTVNIFKEGKSILEYLGVYSTPEDAHKAWQVAKIECLQISIERYKLEKGYDVRVENSLQARIQKIKLEAAQNLETLSL